MKEQGIDCLYLCRIPYEYGKESIMATGFDPRVHINARCGSMPRAAAYSFACPINPRNAVRFADYLSAVHAFAEEIRTRLIGSRYCESVLVLGTEEFMFPTFAVGEMIKRQGCAGEVKIHSTTRSPIIASGEGDYPLNCRYQIRSPYDLSRTTYVYNLRRYDRVIILTDATETPEGMNDLCNALRLAGSGDIAIAAWKYESGGEKI